MSDDMHRKLHEASDAIDPILEKHGLGYILAVFDFADPGKITTNVSMVCAFVTPADAADLCDEMAEKFRGMVMPNGGA